MATVDSQVFQAVSVISSWEICSNTKDYVTDWVNGHTHWYREDAYMYLDGAIFY